MKRPLNLGIGEFWSAGGVISGDWSGTIYENLYGFCLCKMMIYWFELIFFKNNIVIDYWLLSVAIEPSHDDSLRSRCCSFHIDTVSTTLECSMSISTSWHMIPQNKWLKNIHGPSRTQWFELESYVVHLIQSFDFWWCDHINWMCCAGNSFIRICTFDFPVVFFERCVQPMVGSWNDFLYSRASTVYFFITYS